VCARLVLVLSGVGVVVYRAGARQKCPNVQHATVPAATNKPLCSPLAVQTSASTRWKPTPPNDQHALEAGFSRREELQVRLDGIQERLRERDAPSTTKVAPCQPRSPTHCRAHCQGRPAGPRNSHRSHAVATSPPLGGPANVYANRKRHARRSRRTELHCNVSGPQYQAAMYRWETRSRGIHRRQAHTDNPCSQSLSAANPRSTNWKIGSNSSSNNSNNTKLTNSTTAQ